MLGGVGDAGLDVVVVTLVLVLLLAPHQVGIDVLVDFSLHQIKGEWRELQRQRDASGLPQLTCISGWIHELNSDPSAQFGPLAEGRAPYLLDAHDRDGIVHASVLAFPDQLIVDLASAENHSLHLLWVDSCGPVIWDYPLKVCACEITHTHTRSYTRRLILLQIPEQKRFIFSVSPANPTLVLSILTWQHVIKAGFGLGMAQQ